ncbi:uncharacterized protein [Rutidosis leptorrhynchoides]|uniref:uncharacterized protein n=1 Tax=Rutidosis leptorrhynchoides TaxID=125765 RepID=UPI003A99ACFD
MHFGNGNLEGSIEKYTTKDYVTENGINRPVGSDIVLSSSDSCSELDTPRKREPKSAKLINESSITKVRSLQWDESSISTLELEASEEGSSNAIIQMLKSQVAALTRQASVSELELQSLRKKIIKEIKKNQDLKEECEKLKGSQNCTEEVKVNGMLLIDEGDPWVLLQELRQELNHEKELNSSLRLQLQKTQDLKSKSMLMSKSICFYGQQLDIVDTICETDDDDDDEEQRELEAIVREHNGTKETYLLEQKIIDLYNESELYKREKDELEMQIEQIALDYEILKQEKNNISYKLERIQLEEQLKMQNECTQIEKLKKDLETKTEELSKSTLVINELESHIKNLEDELENQAREFEVDIENLMRAKTEQEQKVIRAEESLRKIRLQNVNAASRLQEELKRLSQKMAYTFEVNEKSTIKAMEEANKIRAEKTLLEEAFAKVKKCLPNLDDCFQEKLVFLENQIVLKSTQVKTIRDQMEVMNGDFEHQKRISESKIQRLNERIEYLETERFKELDTDNSENVFLHKEKELQLEIEELEKKLNVLVQKSRICSDHASLPEMKQTDDHNMILKISPNLKMLISQHISRIIQIFGTCKCKGVRCEEIIKQRKWGQLEVTFGDLESHLVTTYVQIRMAQT